MSLADKVFTKRGYVKKLEIWKKLMALEVRPRLEVWWN